MSIFKCKMCGGSLEIKEDSKACECEYCGLLQTLPSDHGDEITSRFNRANELRISCNFDKAMKIYEEIVSLENSEAEAYWGMVLCKYGVEYVEDPATSEKIPTCHMAQYDAVQADEDYKNAIKYSDENQRRLYEQQAAHIDRLQKDILSIVNQEEPFDVFICYKETDENGKRTTDSVIANDIYHQLTNEGYKVFYAAITLEDKIGRNYEPYIFAALNSAKVMLVLGTKEEYFNAVWVKNEWSRYLRIMKKSSDRLLIPCYKDIDPYNLPAEFSHLQAQDMGKIGFINDLIRGIKKVTSSQQANVVKETVHIAPVESVNVENLIKRGMLSIENSDWNEARKNFDKVLDAKVEETRAHIGLLLAEYHLNDESQLQELSQPFYMSNNYANICRFGSPALKERFSEYNKQATYNCAQIEYEAAINSNSVKQYETAKQMFLPIKDYRDSAEKIKNCETQISEIHEAERYLMNMQLQEQQKVERMQKLVKIIMIAIPVTIVFLLIFSRFLQKFVIPVWILIMVVYFIGLFKKAKFLPESLHKADISIKIIASVMVCGITGILAHFLYSLFDKFI